MRSLCIMVMLCGMSNGAWADGWDDVFSLETPTDSEGNPLENSDSNPYIITDWDAFVSGINSELSTEGVYFKLNYSPVLDSAPEASLSIASDNLDMNGNAITVGSDVNPLTIDDFSSFHSVFSDGTLESNVKYYISVTTENRESAVKYYGDSSNKSNLFLIVDSNVTLSDLSSDIENSVKFYIPVTSDNYSDVFTFYNGLAESSLESNVNFLLIDSSVTLSDLPFADNSSVNYNLSITSSNWDDIVSGYNSLYESGNASNVYLCLDNNINFDNLPNNTLNIDGSNFTFNGTITVGSPTEPLTTPSSSDFYPIFSDDSGIDSNVAYYFSITSDDDLSNANEIASTYSYVNYILTQDIEYTDSDYPSSTYENLIGSYFSFGSNSITVGSEASPITTPSSSDFCSIFSDADIDGNVKYYYSVTCDDDLSNANEIASSYSYINFILTENIDYTDSDYPSESYANLGASNFSFGSCTITAGSEDSPLATPSSDSFCTIFSDGEIDKDIKYYYSVTCDDDLSNADNLANSYSSNDFHFILKDNIAYDDDSFPDSYYSYLSPSNFDFGECSITVASNEFPSSSDISAYKVFNEEALDSKVSYNFTISDEDNLINFFEAWKDLKNNSTVTIGSTITVPEGITSTNLLNYFTTYNSETKKDEPNPITFPNISFVDGAKIILGDSEHPTYYIGAGIVKVFQDDDLQANVQYNIGIGSDWDLSEINKNYETYEENFDVQYMLSESFYLNTLPTASYKFTSENFDFNDKTLTVDNGSSPIDMPSNFVPVFSDETLNQEVIYKLIVGTQAGMEQYLNNSECFDAEDEITLNFNTTKAANAWYDYDLSNYTTFDSYTIDCTGLSEPIFVLLSDKCTSEPFDDTNVEYLYTPSYKLVDAMFKNIVTKPENRGTYFDESSSIYISEVAEFAGHGTEDEPYLIYNYEMLKALVNLVNEQDEDYTSDMHINLMSDINVQGNERLTDIKGQKIIDTPIENVQFSNAFKGHFNGSNHSISGMTRPLFSSLDEATVEYLGIVDCYMATNEGFAPALVEGYRSATISYCYVSGVSDGLIPESGSADYSYAFNPKKYADGNCTELVDENDASGAFVAYNFSSSTEDASGTHYILEDNCYTLTPIDTEFDASTIYTDCTLFIPTNNTIYKYSDGDYASGYGSDGFSTYMSYIKWGDSSEGAKWVETPHKSNVCLLHNVLYDNYWGHSESSFPNGSGYAGLLDLDCAGEDYINYLYSWYIVDKKAFNKTDDLQNSRIKNIYYSRGASAPDGLNTIYLPFAWDPSNDLYDKDGKKITGAEVYVLADKLNENEEFSDSENYTDYTQESTLLFFQPSNDDFAKVSNGLPTILKIPEDNTGWYIKRDKMAHYATYIADNCSSYDYNPVNSYTYDNIYDRYWGIGDADSYDRSFMDMTRLSTDAPGRAFHLGTFTEIEKRTFDSGKYDTYTCYKLNSAGTGMASVTSNSSVQPFRTFVAIAPSANGNSAPALKLGFCGIYDDSEEEQPTMIDGAPAQGIHLMTTDESKVYSIDGRYVGQYGNKKLAPGMYIMNGKKFVVK